MSLISGNSIKSLLGERIDIEPWDDKKVRGASVDIEIGKLQSKVTKDQQIIKTGMDSSLFSKDIKTNTVVINPGELVIGYTKEGIYIDKGLTCLITHRRKASSLGLNICGFVHPMAGGKQRISIQNVGPRPIRVSVGDNLCQAFFFQIAAHEQRDKKLIDEIGEEIKREGYKELVSDNKDNKYRTFEFGNPVKEVMTEYEDYLNKEEDVKELFERYRSIQDKEYEDVEAIRYGDLRGISYLVAVCSSKFRSKLEHIEDKEDFIQAQHISLLLDPTLERAKGYIKGDASLLVRAAFVIFFSDFLIRLSYEALSKKMMRSRYYVVERLLWLDVDDIWKHVTNMIEVSEFTADGKAEMKKKIKFLALLVKTKRYLDLIGYENFTDENLDYWETVIKGENDKQER